MMAVLWSVEEVQTFLSLIAEERIQRELDGTMRNENVFQEVTQLLAAQQPLNLQMSMMLSRQ